jgi:hypothetical protein
LAQRDPDELLDEIAFFTLAAGRAIGGPPGRLSTASIEREFLVQVKSGLRDLRADRMWILHEPKVNFIASLDRDDPIVEGRAAPLFVWQASWLIREHRSALHQCQRCTRWFVAARPFQKYCSIPCGRVVHNGTYQTKLRSATPRKVTTRHAGAAAKS